MRLRGLAVLACTGLAACGHEQPFQPLDESSNHPFIPGVPARVTYNPGADLHPAWLPDGSQFVYAWQQLSQPDLDRCLGFIDASGGTRVRTVCNPSPTAIDSTDLFDEPSPSPDGRLLYIRGISPQHALAPSSAGVYVGPLSDPLAATKLLNLPYTVPGGLMHSRISHARWVSATRVMYIGDSVTYVGIGAKDTIITGIEIVDLDLSGAVPSVAVVPGTQTATSIALTSGGDTLVYTLAGDSRVFARALSTGVVSVLHDFGALGTAQDVALRGDQLVAVVGNRPQGGRLWSVDLTSGSESLLPSDQALFFRRPAFSPTGAPVRLVVEGYPLTFIQVAPGVVDTVASDVGDLYLYEAP
jgi:Tol biopolymer transport system component